MADCCLTLDNILKVCGGGNTPGLKTKLYIACAERVDTIPAVDDYPTTGAPHTISTAITMSVDDAATPDVDETGKFFCWAFSKIDNSYNAVPIGDDGSGGWDVTVNFFIPKLNALSTFILNNTANGEFIVLCDDKCGNRRLIGAEDDGASVLVTEQTNDKNGYVIQVKWTTAILPYFYTGNIVT